MSMMNFIINKILLSIIFVFLLFIGCDRVHDNLSNSYNESNNVRGEGLCIYPTKVEYTSDLSYQNFDVESAPIMDNPIISYGDIISYDTTFHILNLTYSRDSLKSKIRQIEYIGLINVYGKPFLVTLDSLKIYGGWFWSSWSSIPCHWVVIEPDALFNSLRTNEIRIKLGFPTETTFIGEDPRNNKDIFNRIIEDGKAK